MVANMREFTVAIDQVGNRYGTLPTAESPAMRELSDEQQYAEAKHMAAADYAGTHGLGELTLRAAADYVRTFAQAFAPEYPPLYGHLVVARSALEAAVVSWWLSEPRASAAMRESSTRASASTSTARPKRVGWRFGTTRLSGWMSWSRALTVSAGVRRTDPAGVGR